MISVSEAKNIIRQNVSPLPAVPAALQNAAGLLLDEDVFSETDIPPFNQSSVDGYAFRFADFNNKEQLFIKGEIAAGAGAGYTILPQHAARIFTGAPVPEGADTVVMQEKTTVENNLLIIEDAQLLTGSNVRLKGADIKEGELALKKGIPLSPAAIGFLAGMGIAKVKAVPIPAVSIIVTGNELQQPGNRLNHGQVYESNSFMLNAALQQLHIPHATIIFCNDRPDDLTGALSNALSKSDIVLLTGGVSVGDYDFVPAAAEACGVKKLFHKIKQRPGKPLFFGRKENRLVFGLPGNPSSVLTCFYEYVLPAMNILNSSIASLKTIYAPLAKPFSKQSGLTHFIKAVYDGKTVLPLGAQESYRLSSFAKANCLAVIDEDSVNCNEGDMTEVHLLQT